MGTNSKGLLESKTFWIAVAQAVVGASVVFHGAYPDAGWLLLGKSLVDVVIRYYTEKPVAGLV